MAKYRGDGFEYMGEIQNEAQENLKKHWKKAVKKAKQADDQLQGLNDEFFGTISSNFDAQQDLDSELADQSDLNQQNLSSMQAQTDDIWGRADGAIQGLGQDKRSTLERLYRES